MDPELDADGNPIVTDSSSGSGAIGTGNDDRIARLNQIANQHEKNVEDQFADVHDDDSTSPFRANTDEEDSTDPNAEPVVVPPVEVVPPEIPAPESKKFKLKVNGKDIELTEEQMIERVQKIESADDYLRIAKERANPAPVNTGPTAEEIQRRQDEEDKALARALQMGSEEEALAAVRKIREQASTRPSVTTDDVARTIDQRLMFRDAITAFRTEYKDIADDPLLWKLATEKDEDLLRAGDQRSYADRFTEIGDELRTWVKGKIPVAADPAPTDPPNDKLAKKALVPKVPVPASAKNKPVEPDNEDEETPQQVIANIAKSRGGPQWMRS